MISKKQLEEASFWGEDLICLSCGAVGAYADALAKEEAPLDNDAGVCQTCGSPHIVDVSVAKLVADNLNEIGDEYGMF